MFVYSVSPLLLTHLTHRLFQNGRVYGFMPHSFFNLHSEFRICEKLASERPNIQRPFRANYEEEEEEK